MALYGAVGRRNRQVVRPRKGLPLIVREEDGAFGLLCGLQLLLPLFLNDFAVKADQFGKGGFKVVGAKGGVEEGAVVEDKEAGIPVVERGVVDKLGIGPGFAEVVAFDEEVFAVRVDMPFTVARIADVKRVISVDRYGGPGRVRGKKKGAKRPQVFVFKLN